eukprot:NODE_3243_length_688_cov_2908.516432_g2306_i0.p1 GENE.NODE_3243_length_688_cov_2908.516432_g2306_i0~~NODE_3243_length_688_cov_2908.516432_g2306_i0.p1  ORF type:complete len:157 (-),score=50.61 NODE_3243_length_688_cov_2908.516432_g2306_i0:162-632(-)
MQFIYLVAFLAACAMVDANGDITATALTCSSGTGTPTGCELACTYKYTVTESGTSFTATSSGSIPSGCTCSSMTGTFVNPAISNVKQTIAGTAWTGSGTSSTTTATIIFNGNGKTCSRAYRVTSGTVYGVSGSATLYASWFLIIAAALASIAAMAL